MSSSNLTPICDPDNHNSQAKDPVILPADAVLAEQAFPLAPKDGQKHLFKM